MKVCLGGTFNILHKGHKKLIQEAIKCIGKDDSILIGLTSDEMIKNKKNQKSYNIRTKNLEIFLQKKGVMKQTEIRKIHDKYGPTLDEDFDIIIVSSESYNNALEINRIREKNNQKPMKIIKISYVLAKDEKPISSTRITNKEIDENGNIL